MSIDGSNAAGKNINGLQKLADEYKTWRLGRFQRLFDEYSALLLKELPGKLKRFDLFLDEYANWRRDYYASNKATAPGFNPLDLFNVKFDELTHSNVLAWLLDPYGSHHQGNLFFSFFLSYFGYNINYATWDYKVEREYSGSESIVDILIYGKNFIFYVENKTLSPEGSEQTHREYRDLMRLANSLRIEKSIFPIFLSPDGMPPANENWRSISYYELARAFDRSLNEVKSDYVRSFVKSWLSTLKTIS